MADAANIIQEVLMLIFGNGEFASVMQFWFSCPLTVHRAYMKGHEYPFEEAEPQDLLIAIGPGHQNRNREKVYLEAQERNFPVMSYISKHAIVNGVIGLGVIIFEANNIQPFASIGNNTVLWSGSHIGHHAKIGNHCFITSHVVVSGSVVIGDYTFVGVNATINDHITIGKGCIIQAGAVVDRNLPDDSIFTRDGLSKIPAHKVKL